MSRCVAAALLLLSSTTFAQFPNAASAGSHVYVEPWQTLVYDTISVKAGQGLQYNFGLTRGTRLSAQFQVKGGLNDQIGVLLLDADNYQRYVANQPYNFFQGTSGTIHGVGQYTFVIPHTGVYYVVLDNRRAWLLPRTVTLQAALEAAQWWSNQVSTTDAVAKMWMDDRHTLSPQRARNIGHWLNNERELIPRWQKLMIPNMQTEVLQALMRNPEGFNREAVRAELSRRGVTAQN